MIATRTNKTKPIEKEKEKEKERTINKKEKRREQVGESILLRWVVWIWKCTSLDLTPGSTMPISCRSWRKKALSNLTLFFATTPPSYVRKQGKAKGEGK